MKEETKKEKVTQMLDINNVVSRSSRLLKMGENPFDFGTLKVLDTFLSKINPLDNSIRTVKFTKKEYEELLGVTKIPKSRLEMYTDQLQSLKVKLPLVDGGYASIVLFSLCRVFKEKGENVVELTCSAEANDIFFNLGGAKYIKYQLRNVINLSSSYSMFLYYYLLENEYKGRWEVSISELKRVLYIKDGKYKENKEFMKFVIKNSAEEINKRTNIRFIYNTLKKNGRSISHIEFLILEKRDFWEFSEKQLSEVLSKNKENIIQETVKLYKELLYFLPKPTITNQTKEKILKVHNSSVEFLPLFLAVGNMAKNYESSLLDKISLEWICDNCNKIMTLRQKELQTKIPSKEFKKLINRL